MATVMVLDDEELVRAMVMKLLQHGGHQVLAFPDAAPALATDRFEDIDVIVTDLEMPTTGEEFIQRVRGRGIQTPIIAMSGNLSEEKSHYLKSIGAQATVRKPFTLPAFLQLVQSCI